MRLNRFIKIGGIILFSASILLVTGLILFKILGPSYLIPYVIDKVSHETNGRYALIVSGDSLEVSFIDMSVRLGNTEFKRDTSVLAYSGIDFLDKFDIHAEFESFNIKTLNLVRYLITKKIVVDEISLEHPEIVVRKNRQYNTKGSTSRSESDTIESSEVLRITPTDSTIIDSLAWKEFRLAGSAHLPHLKVKRFKIGNADFSFYSSYGKNPIQEVRGLTFDLNGFQLLRQSDFAIEDVFLSINYASSMVSKNTARLTVHGVALHPSEFHLDSLHFGHVVDKYDINRIKGFRASWLDIHVKDINLYGLHPAKLINDSTILIDKVSVGLVNLNLFKDKEEPKINPEHKTLPQEKIRNISSGIMIDTIEVLHADLVIDMEAATAHLPGQVTFYNTNVLITNITNIKEDLLKNANMRVSLSSLLLNKIPLTLDYTFKLNSPEDKFNTICKVAPFEAPLINGFIGSQFFMELQSGHINKFDFAFEGNNKVNVGTMDFEYTDLKIRKMEGYEKYIEGRPKTGFIAGIGNVFVPTNRSKEQKGYKVAAIYYEKEYNRDLVHGTIMAMLSGILSSVGLSSKNIDKQRQKAEALSEEDIEKSAVEAQKKADKVDESKAKKEHKKNKKENKKPDGGS